jgi:uncharacterized protein (DUF1330 family)
MAVYLVNTYNITKPELFQAYPPEVAPLLAKYGAKVLAYADDAVAIEGHAKAMNAIIEFPSEQAVRDLYDDPEYQTLKQLRHDSTADCSMVLVKQFGS